MQEISVLDAQYRLIRLRRLLGVGLVLPAASVLLIGQIYSGHTVWLQSGLLAFATPLWVGVLVGLLLRFPCATTETLAVILTACTLVLLGPSLAVVAETGPETVSLMVLVPLTFALGAAIFFGFVKLASKLAHFAPDQTPLRRLQITLVSPLPPEALFAATSVRPNSSHSLRKCGPSESDGFFEVTLPKSDVLMPRDLRATAQNSKGPTYKMRIIEQDSLSQTCLLAFKSQPEPWVQQLSVTPRGKGSVLHCEAMITPMPYLTALNFWLMDYGRDFYIAEIASALNLPSPALRVLPIDTPMAWIARKLAFGTAKTVE